MTAKQKASELVDKYYTGREPNDNLPLTIYWSCAKQCALIAVEEISDVLWEQMADKDRIIYWEDVKHEIEKL